MGNVALVVLTVLLLQLGVACAWGVGIWAMDLPRRPAWHWLGSGLMCAAAMALVLARGVLPVELSIPLSNLTMLATALTLGRGMRIFLGLPEGDRESLAVLGVFLAFSAVALLQIHDTAGVRLQAVTTTLALQWVFGRTTALGYRALNAEFGPRRALVLVAPLGLTFLMASLRLASMVMAPVKPIHVDAPLHVAVALLLLVALLMLHGAMAAMVVMRLVGRLRDLSQRDPLTGLLNRSEWLRQLRAQHRWLGRHGEAFALLAIDIDHFKQVNDRWGHPAGDAVLVNVAQVLLTSSRAFDAVGRLGGEEFVVLLPRTDLAGATRLAERLRAQLADAEILWKQQPLRVTVSIGVALASDADDPPAQLMERADAALYRAKAAGRNRVEIDQTADGAGPGGQPHAGLVDDAALDDWLTDAMTAPARHGERTPREVPVERRSRGAARREFADTA